MVSPASPSPTASGRDPEPTADDYVVRLSSFQGPLDLLLYLIRRAEVDIHDVPISQITDQYLNFVRENVAHIDMEDAGEFLVMAATLVQIKARTLAPKRPAGEGEGDDSTRQSESGDPRAELIQALLAYQRYRGAGEWMERHRVEFWHRHAIRVGTPETPVESPGEGEESVAPDLEIEDVHVLDLSEAYERVAGSIDFARLGDHRVVDEDTPIALHQEDLLERLASSAEHVVSLRTVFAGRSRLEMVGLFLAMLELAKQQRVTIDGDDLDREVAIRLRIEASP
jgi:segregation and condensation protein A